MVKTNSNVLNTETQYRGYYKLKGDCFFFYTDIRCTEEDAQKAIEWVDAEEKFVIQETIKKTITSRMSGIGWHKLPVLALNACGPHGGT